MISPIKLKHVVKVLFYSLAYLCLFTTQLGITYADDAPAAPVKPAFCADGGIISCDTSQHFLTSIGYRGGVSGNTNDILNNLIGQHLLPFIYFLLSAAAVILLIIAGIRYITSSGSPDVTKKARQSIINIILGIALLTASFAVISLILGAIQFLASKAT